MSNTKHIEIRVTSDVDALTRQWSHLWALAHAGQTYKATMNSDGWAEIDSSVSKSKDGLGAKFHPLLYERIGEEPHKNSFGMKPHESDRFIHWSDKDKPKKAKELRERWDEIARRTSLDDMEWLVSLGYQESSDDRDEEEAGADI